MTFSFYLILLLIVMLLITLQTEVSFDDRSDSTSRVVTNRN